MQRAGMSDEAISVALQAENKANCTPPMSDAQMDKIIKSATGFEKGAISISRTLPSFQPAIVDEALLPPRKLELIEGVLRCGHKMILSAKSKAGKTWCLLQLAVGVATGSFWLGKKCMQGRVLYLNMEVDEGTFQWRISSIVESLGADASMVKEGLMVWSLRGQGASFDEIIKELVARVEAGHFSLVILDPVYKLQTDDENSAGAIGTFARQLDELCTSLGCAVVYSHHHSKGGQSSKDAGDRASGSGVFFA